MSEGKKRKIIEEYLQGESYLGYLWQKNCLDGQIKGTIKNIGEDLKKTGEDTKEGK